MVIFAATLPFDEALDELGVEGSRTRLKPLRGTEYGPLREMGNWKRERVVGNG